MSGLNLVMLDVDTWTLMVVVVWRNGRDGSLAPGSQCECVAELPSEGKAGWDRRLEKD